MLSRTRFGPNFLRPTLIAAAFVAVMLLAAGCAVLPGWMGGDRAPLHLDEGETFEAAMDVGEELTMTMPRPADDGYELVGAAFDPKVLDLAGFLLQPGEMPGERGRAVYIFQALAPGETTVEIRIRRPGEPGKGTDVYKTVKVRVDD